MLIDVRGEPVDVDEAQVEKDLRAVRVFTFQDKGRFICITDDSNHPELARLGAGPIEYSLYCGLEPGHPNARGYKMEVEWRGFPTELSEIARRVAFDQDRERKARSGRGLVTLTGEHEALVPGSPWTGRPDPELPDAA